MQRDFYRLSDESSIVWEPEWKSLEELINNTKTMQQMKDIDLDAIVNRGISSLWLMENAAKKVVEEAERTMSEADGEKVITIVCGAGNNGGDGVACAYMLSDKGYSVRAYLCGKREKMTPDELAMEQRLIERGGHLIELFSGDELKEEAVTSLKENVKSCVCLIDALFGVGISRRINAPYSDIIDIMNAADFIVSCDIPSGINGDTGEIMGVAVKADSTVTFSCIKEGLLKENSQGNIGTLIVVPIGIPEACLK